MAHEIESMSYALDANGRGVPWHGLGKGKVGGMTFDEALALTPELAAQVDAWTLQAVSPDGSRIITIDSSQPIGAYVANVREPVVTDEGVKPEVVLGVVTDTYERAQTREQYRAIEQLVSDSGLVVETAMSLAGGRLNVVTMRMPEVMRLAGDETMPYLFVLNSFDGSRALTFGTTLVRIVCRNTLNMALGSAATRTYSLRHTGSLADKLDEAREALALTQRYHAAAAKRADQLARTKLGKGDMKRLLEATFPMPTRREGEDAPVFRRREVKTREAQLAVRELIRTADDLAEHRDNAWGFLNGVIDWNDHVLLGFKGKGEPSLNARERRMRRLVIEPTEHTANAERAIDRVLVLA